MGRAFEVRKKSMAKTAASKSKLYARYGKEIYIAAKNGVPDLELNLNLKRVIEKAKRDQINGDIIKRAIEKAQGNSGENYQSVRYEAFGPGNAYLIIECLTDNINRTISDIRTVFNKAGGKLGVTGSVMHYFEHLAIFSFSGMTEEETMELLMDKEVDFSDIEYEEGIVTVYASPNSFNQVRQVLLEYKSDLDFIAEEISFLPLEQITISADDLQAFSKMIDLIENCEDVQDVYHNVYME